MNISLYNVLFLLKPLLYIIPIILQVLLLVHIWNTQAGKDGCRDTRVHDDDCLLCSSWNN